MISKHTSIRRQDLLYPELSYQVVGAMFDVFNELGYGHREYVYQRALRKRLKELAIPFGEQIRFPLIFRGEQIGWQTVDFLIDGKIILELKRGLRISSRDIEQVNSYLLASKIKLGILARFSSKGLIYRRIINIVDSDIRKDS